MRGYAYCFLGPELIPCSCCAMQEAIDKGWFRKERELTLPGSGIPDIRQILATALDIAEGVAFLHERGVVHGDLTGGTCIFSRTLTSSFPKPVPIRVGDPSVF